MIKPVFIGADIGGSHITVAGVDPDTKKICTSLFRKQINSDIIAVQFIKTFSELILLCMRELHEKNIVAICSAFPSAFDYQKGIALYDGSNQKFKNLNGIDISKELSKILGRNFSFSFCNDALSFAFGEYSMLETTNKNLLAITLGSGLGTSFIHNYQLMSTTDSTIPNNGELYNWQYKNGLAEEQFCSRFLVNQYHYLTGVKVEGVKQINDLASNKNNAALSLFKKYGTDLGKFLFYWVAQSKIEIIVIGGNISGAWDFFYPSLQEVFDNNHSSCKIYPSMQPESSSIIGAVIAHLEG